MAEPMRMTIDLQQLMLEAVQTCRSPAISMGFSIADGCLCKIAVRACEIQDKEILDQLLILGLVNVEKAQPPEEPAVGPPAP